jgi:hypothetical protein
MKKHALNMKILWGAANVDFEPKLHVAARAPITTFWGVSS